MYAYKYLFLSPTVYMDCVDIVLIYSGVKFIWITYVSCDIHWNALILLITFTTVNQRWRDKLYRIYTGFHKSHLIFFYLVKQTKPISFMYRFLCTHFMHLFKQNLEWIWQGNKLNFFTSEWCLYFKTWFRTISDMLETPASPCDIYPIR